jgi:hypothetical protein
MPAIVSTAAISRGARARRRHRDPPVRATSGRLPSHALSCLAARGGRLHSPGDAQAEPSEADVRRRAAALVGHRAAGLPRADSSRRDRPDDPSRPVGAAGAARVALVLCHDRDHALGVDSSPLAERRVMSSTWLAWLDAPARGHERSRSREACRATVAPQSTPIEGGYRPPGSGSPRTRNLSICRQIRLSSFLRGWLRIPVAVLKSPAIARLEVRLCRRRGGAEM